MATAYRCKYIRRLVHNQKICHQRSNELAANMPVIVEPLEVPSSSKQALAPMKRTVPDVVHPVDEILSGYDGDVSSIRDGFAIW